MRIELEREETVQQLCRLFAHDHLSTQELEKRIAAAYHAESLDDLRALTAGFPVLAPEAAAPAMPPRGSATQPSLLRPEQHVRAVFGSVKKRGEWVAAERTRVKAVFAEVELDFREAQISPGVTIVHVDAAFGAVRIIVPPGLHVVCDGSAVFGEFSHKTFLNADPGSDAPTLHIVGRVLFGEVKVVMRLPDDEALEAYRRR